MLTLEYDFDDFFTIEEIREHCRVDFEDDDNQLIIFTEAALEVCAGYINGYIMKKGQSEEEFFVEHGINETNNYWIIPFSKRVKAAALLVTADLYANREANTDYSTYENRAFNLLLGGLKNVNFGIE